MNPLAETAIRQMIADGFSPAVPDDLPDLIDLDRLGDIVTQGSPSREWLDLLEPEVHVGGKVLRRMSIGARDFFNERPDRWFDGDEEWFMRSLFYCLAEGHNPAALWAHQDARQWRKHLRAWFRDVDCSWRAALGAVDRFLAQEKAADGELVKVRAARPDHGWLVEVLCNEYGHTPHYWVWECPESTVTLLWNALLERKEAQRRASGEKFARDPDSRAARVLFRFRDAEESLRKKIKERANG